MARKVSSISLFKLLLLTAAIFALCLKNLESVDAAVNDELDENVPPLVEPEEAPQPPHHATDDHPSTAEKSAAAAKPVLKIVEEKPFSPPELSADEKLYMYEPFRTTDLLDKSWYISSAKKDGVEEALAKYEGQWKIEEAKAAHLKSDLGLVVKSKAKHHAIATRLTKPFTFGDSEPLVLQFDLRFQEGQDCGGGYVKLLSSGQEQDLHLFMDKTPFTIMFGPDKCGLDSKLHFIVKLRNPITGELEEKKASQPKDKIEKFVTDKLTHLYTLELKPDNQFSIYIDQKLVHSGSLLKDMDPPLNPPKEIKDPNAAKPVEWDDREQIADDSDVKPESWVEERLVPDPKAEKPEDWDDEMDGVWEAPKVDNPKFKGEWKPKQIKNPNYSGVWKQPMIPNPAYFENNKPFQSLAPISAVGIELWTMSADIMFDNFLITSDKKQADRLAKETWALKAEREKAADGITATSTLTNWYDYAVAHPWVWAMFILAAGIPIVFIIMSYARKARESNVGQKYDENKTKLERENAQRRPLSKKPTGSEDEEEDDDELRGDAEEYDDEVATQTTGRTTGQDLLRSQSPSSRQSAATTTASQRATATQQSQRLKDDASPPALEGDSEGSEEETAENVNGDDDYEGEESAEEPPAEAGDKLNKANKKVLFEEQTVTTKTTTTKTNVEDAVPLHDDAYNSAVAESGTNLRARARRARREE